MGKNKKTGKRPNCFKCRHFYITHEAVHPYGCLGMGFKSRNLPAAVVFESSGLECQLFSRKSKS